MLVPAPNKNSVCKTLASVKIYFYTTSSYICMWLKKNFSWKLDRRGKKKKKRHLNFYVKF